MSLEEPPVTIGSALRDQYADELAAETPRAAPTSTDGHLCPSCLHAPVCAVATAIRSVGGDDEISISRCGAFAPLDAGVDLEPNNG